jgi:hypothetical protein
MEWFVFVEKFIQWATGLVSRGFFGSLCSVMRETGRQVVVLWRKGAVRMADAMCATLTIGREV